MKLADMTPQQRTEYQKLAKRRSREKAKQEQAAREIPNVQDYILPKAQQDQLSENSQKLTVSIAAELPELTDEDGRMIQMMADVIYGHEHKFTKQVYSPCGFLYGNFFPDAASSELIEHVHRFPNMLESKTFLDLYQQFLKLVQKLSKNEWFDPDFAREIESELNGTYKLRVIEMPKPKLEPAPQLPKLPELRVPCAERILAEGGARLIESLRGEIPQDALRYLYHGGR